MEVIRSRFTIATPPAGRRSRAPSPRARGRAKNSRRGGDHRDTGFDEVTGCSRRQRHDQGERRRSPLRQGQVDRQGHHHDGRADMRITARSGGERATVNWITHTGRPSGSSRWYARESAADAAGVHRPAQGDRQAIRNTVFQRSPNRNRPSPERRRPHAGDAGHQCDRGREVGASATRIVTAKIAIATLNLCGRCCPWGVGDHDEVVAPMISAGGSRARKQTI